MRATFPASISAAAEMARRIAYAHSRGVKVLVALNTFPRAGAGACGTARSTTRSALRRRCRHPRRHRPARLRRRISTRTLRLHLSVQAAAANPEAIDFYVERFGVKRVVLPRVLTVAEIAGTQSRDRLRDRGVRVRRPVRDGRRALLAVLLRDRPLAQHERRLLAGQPRRLSREGRRTGLAARRLHHQPRCRPARRCPIRPCARGASAPAR